MGYMGSVNLINIYFKENPFNNFIKQQQKYNGPGGFRNRYITSLTPVVLLQTYFY